MKALVIDDSRAMRMVLARMLSSLGAEVTQAVDGLDGLAKLAEGGQFDLVLVDWHMPEMEGIDFVAAARAEPYFFPGLIVRVTTETESARVARALELGADEYVMKPFTPDMIAEKLTMLGLDLGA